VRIRSDLRVEDIDHASGLRGGGAGQLARGAVEREFVDCVGGWDVVVQLGVGKVRGKTTELGGDGLMGDGPCSTSTRGIDRDSYLAVGTL
jgi:hypothetical protein